MLERTLFYGLPLRGLGTASVESLRSYVQRLAFAHHLKPRGLLEILKERIGGEGAPLFLHSMLRDWRVHGSGPTGTRLCAMLQAATGVELARSTLGHISGLLAEQHLVLTGIGRYCPVCVQENAGGHCDDFGEGRMAMAGGAAHGQLLWEVSAVSACPAHGVRLQDAGKCGAPEQERLTVNSKPSLSPVCRGCGSIGFRCASGVSEAASASEVLAAQQVGQLLAVSDEVASAWTAKTLQAGLRAVVALAYEGQVVRAAREAGLSRSSVCSWAAGSLRPNLAGLVQLACHSRTDIVEMFGGRAVPLSGTPWVRDTNVPPTDIARRRSYRRLVNAAEVEAALRAAVLEAEPPTLRRFADRHQTSPRHLRERWPDLSEALANAASLRRQMEAGARAANATATYERAAADLLKQGKPVTPKLLQQTTGLVAFSQNQSRLSVLRDVVRRHSAT